MTFPDTENLLRQFLQDKLGGVPVKTRIPNPRPDTFVRVWRSGGGAVNRVLDEPLITVESFGADDTVAFQNANVARSALLDHSSQITLVRGISDRSGIYYDPDPVSGSPRYTFTVELSVRRARAA